MKEVWNLSTNYKLSSEVSSSSKNSRQHSAFNGVVILTLALVIVKVLSAIYRVPYQNILGDSGLYAYQQIYPIVALGMILSMNAVPSAVTQVFGSHSRTEVFSKTLLRFQMIGLIIFSVILVFSHPLALLMGDAHLAPMLKMASFSYLFIGILGVIRGFYQSRQQMNIPAISQVIEQCIRVCVIIIAILMFMFKEWTIYQAGALAILASALGFLGSSLYLLATRPFRLQLNQHSYPLPWKQLILAIFSIGAK